MATPEKEIIFGDLVEQPAMPDEVSRRLVLVPPPGLAEVTSVAEELKDPMQAQKNIAFLDQQGVKIDIDPDGSSVQISLSKEQEALACSLLYGLEVTGLQEFPGRVPVTRPDFYGAIATFLLAKQDREEKALKLSDSRLAISYDHLGRAIVIKNINDSEHNGLRGAPRQLLEAVIESFDIDDETARIKQPLAWEQASRYNNPQGIKTPGNS